MKHILSIVLNLIIGLLASWIAFMIFPSVPIIVVLIGAVTFVAITAVIHPAKTN
tara:strand:- start:12195 stop:12356 length:162 start_codon:yes stop_codon:yes gene_type:complete